MVTTVALTIIVGVLTLVGIIFNLIPKQINPKLMGDLTEEVSQVTAAFRIILGALRMIFGIVAISSRIFPIVEVQT